MGRFIVSVLDFLCVTAIVLCSIIAFVVGGKFGEYYGGYRQFQIGYAILFAAGAFLVGTIVFGAILALTEVAKNTRKMIKILEGEQRSIRKERSEPVFGK